MYIDIDFEFSKIRLKVDSIIGGVQINLKIPSSNLTHFIFIFRTTLQ